MELRQLEYFLAVAEHGSFTAAAREVPIVQSALSTSIRNLERELGSPLFERTTRRVVLSEAGRALLPVARRVLGEVDAARISVADVTGLRTGGVAVGTIETLTSVDLPAALASFHRAHPGVRITVRDALVPQLLDMLRSGELDLAYVLLDSGGAEGLATFGPHTEKLVLAFGPDHPLVGTERISLATLADEPFVTCRPGHGLETASRRLAGQAGIRRRIGCQVGQVSLLVELVRAGLGVAILPESVAARGGLPHTTITQSPACRTVALAARSPRPVNPIAAALLDHLIAAQETAQGLAQESALETGRPVVR